MAYQNRQRGFGGKGGGKKFGGGSSWKKHEGRDGYGRGAARSMLYDAVCSSCGKDCKVPFRPIGKKPVLCNACFGRGVANESKRFGSSHKSTEGFRSASTGDSSVAKQLKEMNEKLDAILEALDV